MTHELTHLDLFSGIGGFAIAAGWAGFRTVGFSEVEPYACRVLEHRWPGVPNIGDVRITANFARFRGVTVLTGGFPCQPWSAAGKRGGTNDDRHLWPAMLRAIEVVRPTWIIGENVPGIIGLELDRICSALEGIGYSVQPVTIPACAAGAWHVRVRLWILAHLDDPGKSQPARDLQESRGRAGDGIETTAPHPLRLGRKGWGIQKAQRRPQPEIIPADIIQPGLDAGAQTGIHRGQESSGPRDEHPAGLFQWPAESPVVRMVHGIPHRAHRIKGLGNAILPQVPAPLFRWIAQIETHELTQ